TRMWSRNQPKSSLAPRPRKVDGYIVGPALFEDATVTSRTSPPSEAPDEYSPTPTLPSDLTFRSPESSSRSTKKSKKSLASTRSKKDKRVCEYSADECPRRREEAETGGQEKSDYEKRKRAKILELAKQAEQDHEKLLVQRTRSEQAAKELESSLSVEQDARNRSMATMKSQLEGIEWRGSRDLKDLRKEIEQWKGKTAKSGELAKRVDGVEKRVGKLEKAYADRKATMDMVEKNWADFGRLKTQSMALEVTQIKNRRGAMHLERMPKDVAQTTAKNLYRLCDDLQRLNMHLNTKSELTRLIEEALTLAEAIAPLYGVKEDYIDSRENTSSTNVSLGTGSGGSAATTASASSTDNSTASPGSSVPTSPNTKATAPIRASLRRAHKDPTGVTIPPSNIHPMFKSKENLHIDAPSLRERSPAYYSNYYSNSEMSTASKANGAPAPIIPSAESTVVAPPTATPAPPPPAAAVPAAVQQPAAAAAPAAPPTAPETPAAAPIEAPAAAPPPAAAELPAAPAAAPPAAAADPATAADASISLSVDSDTAPVVKEEKKKSSSRRSSKERKQEETK
ncbi:hypothetical protein PMAYCL1PPCAC_22489, partial [Pristionchus mayeri]